MQKSGILRSFGVFAPQDDVRTDIFSTGGRPASSGMPTLGMTRFRLSGAFVECAPNPPREVFRRQPVPAPLPILARLPECVQRLGAVLLVRFESVLRVLRSPQECPDPGIGGHVLSETGELRRG